jgi:mediator of RNA polymerase II transcription subunit 12
VSVEEIAAVSLISSYEYHIVRSSLEDSDDLAILADVVGITTSSLDPAVLAAVADTLNFHLKAFRAIGAFDPLFGRVAMRYAALRTIRFPERELILSLHNLARNVQPDGQLLQLLVYDLNRLDQKNSIAACSPASDNMGEVMQHSSTYSDDEIERILSSGTSMDQQMMARVLRKIVSNLEDHLNKGCLQFESYPAWFWRLRNFDEATFDVVLQEWLESCLVNCQMSSLRVAIPLLVATGCMALSNFLDVFRASIAPSKREQLVEPYTTATEGLYIFLPAKDMVKSCSPHDAYRYQLEQYKLCYESDIRIVHSISEVTELVSSALPNNKQQSPFKWLTSEPVVSIVKQHIVSDAGCLSKVRPALPGQSVTNECFKQLLNHLLDPVGHFRMYHRIYYLLRLELTDSRPSNSEPRRASHCRLQNRK